MENFLNPSELNIIKTKYSTEISLVFILKWSAPFTFLILFCFRSYHLGLADSFLEYLYILLSIANLSSISNF